ncbi:hypothetical protein BSY17_1694 [Sphingobium sp. RAC03]|nr:hypothetical protein BSY17_1694 [Sphingobium sp. RAC03]
MGLNRWRDFQCNFEEKVRRSLTRRRLPSRGLKANIGDDVKKPRGKVGGARCLRLQRASHYESHNTQHCYPAHTHVSLMEAPNQFCLIFFEAKVLLLG